MIDRWGRRIGVIWKRKGTSGHQGTGTIQETCGILGACLKSMMIEEWEGVGQEVVWEGEEVAA